MEASLILLMLHVALAALFKVAQHLAKHHLQCIGRYTLHRMPLHLFGLEEALPRDVERGAIHVRTVLRGIAIALAQAVHIMLGTKYGSDDDAVGIQSFGRK